MTATILQEDVDSLWKVIATRLCAARRVSGMKQPQVAAAVGQKNMTQVSLWESGERRPKLADLIMMAKLYGVPMDFLCGLSNDPLADAPENNQGFLANMITKAIQTNHMSWVQATSQSVAATIKNHGQDRSDLVQAGKILNDLFKAYNRIKELNPEFDDEVRGASKFESELARLYDLIRVAEHRIDEERRQCEIIDREVGIASGEFERNAQRDAAATVNQMMLDISR